MGGFFVLDEFHCVIFNSVFLKTGIENSNTFKLSPKFLFVLPHARLSWQCHHRRSEVWRILEGSVGVAKSKDDKKPKAETFVSGSLLEFSQGERHRLIGLDTIGVVAEIWKHAEPSHPSYEDDIIRIQDDYNRNGN